jgi:Tol biopolymer transport system component
LVEGQRGHGNMETMKRPSVTALALAFAALACVVGLVAGLAHPPLAHSAFLGRNGKIAFTGARGTGGGSIFTIRPDGSHRRRIAPGFDAAFFSATGHRILAVANERHRYALYLMRANGTHRVRIPHTGATETTDIRGATLAPSGKRIVFSEFVSKTPFRSAVFTMRIDGTHRRRLTPFKRSFPGANGCVFSPNGSRIAYTDSFGLAIMRADGTHRRHIAEIETVGSPDFSPSGKKVVFHVELEADGFDIYSVRADGTHLKRLVPKEGPVWETDPAFSPDGKKIVFRRHRRNVSRGAKIAIINSDGSHLRTLDLPMRVAAPNWGVRP